MTEELKPLPCPFEEWFDETFPDMKEGGAFFELRDTFIGVAQKAWDAALTRSPAWRDIESAPRDGTPILLWGGKPDHYASEQPPEPVVVAWWGVGDDFDPDPEDYEWRYCNYDGGYYGIWHDPMMWAPLSRPLPPEEAK